MRATPLALALALFLPGEMLAANPSDPGAAPDVQDFVLFTESRPVLVRMRVTIDGKPIRERWQVYLRRWFDYLDRNSNGWLNEEELKRNVTHAFLKVMMGIGPNGSTNPMRGWGIEDLDSDSDKRVTWEEYLGKYLNSQVGPTHFGRWDGAGDERPLSRYLMELLDSNKDDALDEAEVKRTLSVLREFDNDDDEVVAIAELPRLNSKKYVMASTESQFPKSGPGRGRYPVVFVPREKRGSKLAQRFAFARKFIEHADTNKNKWLSVEESGFPPALFADLDHSKNGKLEAIEILRWLVFKPDLEIDLRYEPKSEKLIVRPQKGKAPIEVTVLTGNVIHFQVGSREVNIVSIGWKRPARTFPVVANTKKSLEQGFSMIAGKKGKIRASDINNGNALLRASIPFADANLDGALSKDELSKWIDLITTGQRNAFGLTHVNWGRRLFSRLDQNGDGRASKREALEYWQVLSEYDTSGDSKVDRSEIPQRIEIIVGAGISGVPAVRAVSTRGYAGSFRAGAEQPPRWFDRMDINRDGDVTPREFLGTIEQFGQLDTNNDGVLSPKEARSAAQ